MATTSAQVQQLYVAYLGRAADKAGLDYWLNELNADTPTLTLENLRANFVNEQPEYAAIYGGLDRSAQVTKIYENLFGRAPDAAGLAYWTTGEGSTVNADQLLTAFINGAAASDATVVNNKVFVAQAYTDAVGADFNATAAADVIAHVDGTSASVTDALNSIGSGALEGQIPGLALINAHDAAVAAVTAYGVTAASTNATFDTDHNGSVSFVEANGALTAANTARTSVDAATTVTLTANVTNATNALAAAKTAATTAVGADAVTAYDNAVATDTAADAALAANAAATASAQAGLNTALTTTGSAVTFDTLSTAAGVTANFTSAADVLTFLTTSGSDATARAALVTELNKVPTYGAEVVKAGDLGLAAADSQTALNSATTALTNDDNSSAGTAYITAETNLQTATTTLADAQAADADVAAAQAVVDQYTALNKAEGDAATAITNFDNANASVALHNLPASHAGTGTDAAPVKDVFYFADKAGVTDATNINVTSFGAGDSIVLGNNTYTYNSGALSTGDNNKLEFFLVKSGADLQVVLETDAFGSASVATNATTGAVTNANTDHVALITLTGVAATDVTVANGVISHVAAAVA